MSSWITYKIHRNADLHPISEEYVNLDNGEKRLIYYESGDIFKLVDGEWVQMKWVQITAKQEEIE